MIGVNAGHNLNILVFEVVMVTEDYQGGGPRKVRTVGIHPLLVAPTHYAINDTGRGNVSQAAAYLHTKASRAPRTFQLQGTFGHEPRGLLGYVGTGEQRFERFYNEVVRLGDADSQEAVDATINLISGTPGLPLILAAYDEETTLFAVNFYDFWHQIYCTVDVGGFSWDREYANAGASGLISYAFGLKEAGPLIEGSPITSLLRGALTGLATWNDVNEALKSYTIDEIVGSELGVPAILLDQAAETLEGVRAQLEGVQALMGGGAPRSFAGDGGAAFLGACADLERQLGEIASVLTSGANGAPAAQDSGAMAREGQGEEGAPPDLERYDAIVRIEDAIDAARWQSRAGVLYGMAADDYQSWIAGDGASEIRGPAVARSAGYRVTDIDTPASVEAALGRTFDEILRLNRLTPDEALLPGTVLQVPTRRPSGPTPIGGLDTYGSHVGTDALGSDLLIGLAVVGGDLAVVRGPACLQQGQDVLLAEFGPTLLADLAHVPPRVQAEYLSTRIGRALARDSRIRSVDRVSVEDAEGGYTVTVTSTAVTNDQISTGGPT